jgi:hypothetical protein
MFDRLYTLKVWPDDGDVTGQTLLLQFICPKEMAKAQSALERDGFTTDPDWWGTSIERRHETAIEHAKRFFV